MAYDQFDNAYRIAIRKLGAYILARQYKAARLHTKVRALLDDTAIGSNCREVAGTIDSEKELEARILRIEELGGAGGRQQFL
jgi:UDP:flavonoid glycosyltransferase YjiC (YdhE family)